MTKTKMGPNNYYVEETFDQLTAAGSTATIDVVGIRNHTVQIKVATINTNVIVSTEGTLDGTNFFTIPFYTLDSGLKQANLTVGSGQATIVANGTYVLNYQETSMKDIKFTFVSESGGSDATVDIAYYGTNF